MTKQQTLVTKSAGLVSQPNPETAPQGSYHYLQNCVCARQDFVEKRRGFERFSANSATSLFEFQDTLLAHYGTTLRSIDSAGTGTAYSGTYASVGRRIRSIEAVKSSYFTTDAGVQRLDALAGTPAPAGMPAGLDVQITATAGSWLTDDSQVSYRIVWVRRDANNRPILGYPSHRQVFTRLAAAGSTATIVTTTIPDTVVAGDWLWIYRTALSASDVTDPGDEHYLLAEVQVTAGNVSDGYIAWTDTTFLYDDSTPLSTNPNQETILKGNETPPFCKDLALHKEFVFFADTRQEEYLLLRMLTTTGVVASSDSITVGGETYTFYASEDAANKRFQLFTAGTASENLRDTCQSLCKIINRASANLYGFYVSQPNENPGRMEIRGRTLDTDQFSATANDAGTGAIFSPALPTSGTAVLSENDAAHNRLYRSRLGLPDAVPYLNYDDVGAEDNAILRIIPLQDSLIVIKQVGIFRMTGDDESSFSLKVLDPQIRCFAPDSWIALNNQAIGLSDQGIVQASENGIAIISFPMEGDIKKIFSYSGFEAVTHATGYPSERMYALWVQGASGDTYAKQAWVFNFLTEKWAGPWLKNTYATHVKRDEDRLYLAKADETQILRDRKSYSTNYTDYSDESIPITVTDVATTLTSEGETVSLLTVTFSYTLADLEEGWYFFQSYSASRINAVTALSTTSYQITLGDHLIDVVDGAAYAEMPIDAICRTAPETCGNPAAEKDYSVFQVAFDDDGAVTHQVAFHSRVGFATDSISQISYYGMDSESDTGWGVEDAGWGEFGWGDEDPSIQPVIRLNVPTQFRRARAMTTIYRNNSAREHFAIVSRSLTFRPLTDITTRGPR